MADDALTVVIADGSTQTLRSKDLSAGKQGQIVVAAEHVRVFDGKESLVLTTSSQPLASIPGASTHALIYAEGGSATDYARYWQDGSAPTASIGKKLKDHEEILCAQPSNFRAIIGAGTITLRVEYYHYA